MRTITLVFFCLILAGFGCSKTDSVAPAAPNAVVVPTPEVAAPAPGAAIASMPVAAPVAVAPEDRLEPASIENARLPNGSPVSVEMAPETKNKKSPK